MRTHQITAAFIALFGVLHIAAADPAATPAAQIIQTIRGGEEGTPKGVDYVTAGFGVHGDYVYSAGTGDTRGDGNGTIHYFKRDRHTGQMTYAGAIPSHDKRTPEFLSVAGRMYIGWFGYAASALAWYDIEKDTGKPVEKGRLDIKVGWSGSLIADPEGKNLYLSGDGRVYWYKIAANGALEKAGEIKGKGIGWTTLRMSPDGKNLYSLLATERAIAIIDRQPTGEIAWKSSLALEPATPIKPDPLASKLCGISPDGKWVYACLWAHDDPIILTCRRDPATGALTIQETGSGMNSTRADFRIANYRDLNIFFLPSGVGGFIGNSVGVLQSFKFDTATGKLTGFADVDELQKKCASCASLALDAESGLLYGCGPGWIQNPGVWVAKLAASNTSVDRPDVVASTAAPTAKPANDIDWPCWRGPNGDGNSAAKGIRKDFTNGLEKVWQVTGLSPVTCTWSSLSVKGNKLVIMGRHGVIDEVFCFDADKGGPPLWIAEYMTNFGSDYGWGDGSQSTPTIDADKV